MEEFHPLNERQHCNWIVNMPNEFLSQMSVRLVLIRYSYNKYPMIFIINSLVIFAVSKQLKVFQQSNNKRLDITLRILIYYQYRKMGWSWIEKYTTMKHKSFFKMSIHWSKLNSFPWSSFEYKKKNARRDKMILTNNDNIFHTV